MMWLRSLLIFLPFPPRHLVYIGRGEGGGGPACLSLGGEGGGGRMEERERRGERRGRRKEEEEEGRIISCQAGSALFIVEAVLACSV